MDMYYLKLFFTPVSWSSWYSIQGAGNFSNIRENGNKKTTKERVVVALLTSCEYSVWTKVFQYSALLFFCLLVFCRTCFLHAATALIANSNMLLVSHVTNKNVS